MIAITWPEVVQYPSDNSSISTKKHTGVATHSLEECLRVNEFSGANLWTAPI
jgi:hypothetical protein